MPEVAEFERSRLRQPVSTDSEPFNSSDVMNDLIAEAEQIAMLTELSSPEEILTEEDIINTEKIIEDGTVQQEDEYLPMTLSIWSLLKKSAINVFLPFINGMMLGFGEILAHEIGFHYNWMGARVQPPRRMNQRKIENSSKFL